MSDYIISTSSTTDLPESYIKEHGILCLPFSFIISDEQYEDNFGNSMPAPVFYNRLRNGEMSRTSLINADAFEKAFREILESGRISCISSFPRPSAAACKMRGPWPKSSIPL